MTIRTFLANKHAVVLLVSLCIHLALLSNKVLWAEETPLRVAIIDTGDKPPVPPALLDLLVANLSQEKELAVLERQEINAVLREQGHNLALAGNASQNDLVVSGRILGADALVLLLAKPPNKQGLQAIEVRIIETRRGMRFGQTVLMWSENEQTIAQQIQSASEKIISRLQRVRNVGDKLMVVSLAGFRTNELSQEAHRFKRDLESWLELWLASQPGIVVAERTKVLPLIGERKLSSDLPAALGGADVTIDGTFRLDFSSKQPQVELTLRVLRKDRSIATDSLRAPLAERAKLRQLTEKAILKLLAVKHDTKSFDAETESRLLADEAERLLKFGRRYEALDRLIVAYSLDPDSLRIQALLLRAGERFGVGPDFSGATFDAPFYPTALLISDVARQLLDQIEQKSLPSSKSDFYQRGNLLGQIGKFCSLMSQIQFVVKKPSESQLIQHEWLRAAISDLFARHLALVETAGGGDYEGAIYRGLQQGRYWAKGPGEALDQRVTLFQRAATLSHPRTFGVWAFTADHRFRLTDNKTWAARGDLHQLYESYFRKMRESDHAVVQTVGEREAANYAIWVLKDKARAMTHYRRFIQLIVEEIIPNHPQLADHVHGLWLHLNHRTGYLALTDEEAGELWGQVICTRWSSERKSPRASQGWEYRINKTMLHLEKAEEIEQASDLLQTCIAALKASPVGLEPHQISRQWQETLGRLQQLNQGLKQRHPELGGQLTLLPALAVDCQPCLTIEQAMSMLPQDDRIPKSRWFFSGLVPTGSGYAVSFAIKQGNVKTPGATRFSSQEWSAVARLDSKGNPRSVTIYPEPNIFDYRKSRLGGDMGKILRPLVASGESLFLSVPSNGIIWFQPNKASIHFSSKYLEQPSPNHRPVPFEEARQLIPHDRKLYFASGKDPLHPRIYELDYQQGESRILMDARALPEKSPLWGRIGFSITDGPPGKLLLWALPEGGPRNGKQARSRGGHLFLINLQDGSIEEAEQPFRLRLPWVFDGAQHHLGMRTEEGSLAVFNQQTLSLDSCLADRPVTLPPIAKMRLSPQEFVHNAHYLFTSAKRPGGVTDKEWRLFTRGLPKGQSLAASDWLLYSKASTTPQRLQADLLPPPEKVWRYLMNDQNQILLMTNKAVFRITIPSNDDN